MYKGFIVGEFFKVIFLRVFFWTYPVYIEFFFCKHLHINYAHRHRQTQGKVILVHQEAQERNDLEGSFKRIELPYAIRQIHCADYTLSKVLMAQVKIKSNDQGSSTHAYHGSPKDRMHGRDVRSDSRLRKIKKIYFKLTRSRYK